MVIYADAYLTDNYYCNGCIYVQMKGIKKKTIVISKNNGSHVGRTLNSFTRFLQKMLSFVIIMVKAQSTSNDFHWGPNMLIPVFLLFFKTIFKVFFWGYHQLFCILFYFFHDVSTTNFGCEKKMTLLGCLYIWSDEMIYQNLYMRYKNSTYIVVNVTVIWYTNSTASHCQLSKSSGVSLFINMPYGPF